MNNKTENIQPSEQVKIPNDASKKLSLLICTYNEISRLDLIIRRYSKFAEVILLDNQSDDGTIELASYYGIKVINRLKKGFLTIEDIKRGVDECSGEWVHLGGCSEVLTNDLLGLVCETINENIYEAIALSRKSYTWGFNTHNVRYGYKKNGLYIFDNFRFINKKKIDWKKSKIHFELPARIETSKVKFFPKSGNLTIHHFREGEPYLINVKHAFYCDVEAKAVYESSGAINSAKLLIKIFLSPIKVLAISLWKFQSVGGFVSALHNAQLAQNIQLTLYMLKKFGPDFNVENQKIRKMYESLDQND